VKVIHFYVLALNFVRKTIIDILKTYSLINKIYDEKNNSKKGPRILENNASGVQVGDYEQVIIQNLFKV
jgi:hypothetical protein